MWKNWEHCSSKEGSTTEEKISVVSELWLIYPLKIFLSISGLAKSVYCHLYLKQIKMIKIKKL